MRHQHNELAVCRKMREVSDGDALGADFSGEFEYFLVRAIEKLVQQPQFIHQFERRRMDGIAAKIAEEIFMLFKDKDVNTGAREKESQHHSGGTASGDATAGLNWNRHLFFAENVRKQRPAAL